MLRIFGTDIAELPLIATRHKNRGKVRPEDCTANLIGLFIGYQCLTAPNHFPLKFWYFFRSEYKVIIVRLGCVSDVYNISSKLHMFN